MYPPPHIFIQHLSKHLGNIKPPCQTFYRGEFCKLQYRSYLANVHPRVLLAGKEEPRRHLLLLRQSLHVHHVVEGLLSLSLKEQQEDGPRTTPVPRDRKPNGRRTRSTQRRGCRRRGGGRERAQRSWRVRGTCTETYPLFSANSANNLALILPTIQR